MLAPRKPLSFVPALGVQSAQFCEPPVLRRKRYTGRRLQGVRYERSVQEYLNYLYGELYLPSPWLKFWCEGRWRWCQPDGLLFTPEDGRLTIVEVKYQHTADAWWQVRHLYAPVLETMFPSRLWKMDFCEVVKWFDPAVEFPERVILAHDVRQAHPNFKVHIFKP